MRTRSLAIAGALFLSGSTSYGAQVGAQVVALLKEQPRVRVIVALHEPSGTTDPFLRLARVSALQNTVLDGLGPQDFVVTHRYEAIAALGGEVSSGGLVKLAADPLVLQVDVDPPA